MVWSAFIMISAKTPPGGMCCWLCRAEACQSMGADALADQLRAALGIDFHETTPDGRLTLEPVFCLGFAPVRPRPRWMSGWSGRADLAKLTRLVAEVRGMRI